MTQFFETLMTLSICVVLPIMIVWLRNKRKTDETNKRTQIIMTAMEKNSGIDNLGEIVRQMTPQEPSFKERMLYRLHNELMWGSMMTALGVVWAAIGIVSSRWREDFAIPLSITSAIPLAIGIGLLIAYFCGKKTLNKAEE